MNTPRTVKETLIAAAASISSPEAWCQHMQGQTAEGDYCEPWNQHAVRRCALGAIYQFVDTPFLVKNEAVLTLAKAIPFPGTRPSEGVAGFNNQREHADVLALFQRAIVAVTEWDRVYAVARENAESNFGDNF